MPTTTQSVTNSTVRNGVPLDKLFGTIGAVRNDPELARFRFTAVSSWIEGTATRSTFRDWYGVGATRPHAEPWPMQSDHPTLGHGHGATPHEHVLHALAACLTMGIATTAAAPRSSSRRSSPPSRETSTFADCSASTPRYATASPRSGPRSWSKETPTGKRSTRSSRPRAAAQPPSTCS